MSENRNPGDRFTFTSGFRVLTRSLVIWSGLLLTPFLLGSAILVAILFSGWPSRLPTEIQQAAVHTNHLHGVRDPRRPGWRAAARPWDLIGTHGLTPDEDRGRGEETVERGREETEDRGWGEETIQISVAEVWKARTR
jgi:hypothetical protein